MFPNNTSYSKLSQTVTKGPSRQQDNIFMSYCKTIYIVLLQCKHYEPICIKIRDRVLSDGNRHWLNILDGLLNAPVIFNKMYFDIK